MDAEKKSMTKEKALKSETLNGNSAGLKYNMNDQQDFGVCRLSLVPVYEQPDYRTRIYNQMLFGEHYSVTGSKGNWISVQLAYDNSGGWIAKDQHHPITREYFDQINASDYKITTDIASTILYNKVSLNIVMGSIVPISNSELFKIEEQLAFNGESKSLSQKRDAEFLNAILTKYNSAPFLPGGKSPFGIDAAGLIQMAFKISGYRLPRTTEELKVAGRSVSDFETALSGDIVFLKNSLEEVTPAILASNNRVVMMDGFVQTRAIDARGVKETGQRKYSWEIAEIKRILS